MKLLFLDAYHTPENVADTHLESDLIENLIAAGYEISVLCPTPTRGVSDEIREQYKSRREETLYDGKLRISRFRAPREGKNPVGRALRYFWCNLATYRKAIRYRDIDAVFSNSTPPTQGAVGGKAAKKLSKKYKRKVPFVYNLQDIFPDSLVNAHLTKEGSLLWKIGRKLETYTYVHADKIILISQSFRDNLAAKGVDTGKTEIVSNWIDPEAVHPVARGDNALFSEFHLDPQKYIVVYAGNLGEAQGASVITEAARELVQTEEIQFVIFGGGACFEDVKKDAADLPNVFVHELLPAERISEVYSLGDAALITCRAGMGKAVFPSKTWSIMACNTPIIASFDQDSDLARTLTEANAGVCVPPENASALKENILNGYFRWKSGRETPVHSRDYVLANASKEACVKKYAETFKSVIGQ